jgi:hypothetical protein
MKTVIRIILGILICVMGYFLYESIQTPLRFEAAKTMRYNAAIQRLKDIRSAQVAYKSQNTKYTASFDTLITFLKEGSFNVIKQIGDLDDSADIQAGRIIRDTVKVSVLDSLFKQGYPVDSLRFVPYTDNAEFEMGTANLVAGAVNVNVFEAKVANDVLLNDLKERYSQDVINLNAERQKVTGYAGLKVGSLEETTNNAGNWE